MNLASSGEVAMAPIRVVINGATGKLGMETVADVLTSQVRPATEEDMANDRFWKKAEV